MQITCHDISVSDNTSVWLSDTRRNRDLRHVRPNVHPHTVCTLLFVRTAWTAAEVVFCTYLVGADVTAAAICALASSVACRDTVSASCLSISSRPDSLAATPGGVREDHAFATRAAEPDGSSRPRSVRSERSGASATYRIIVSPERRVISRTLLIKSKMWL